MPDENSQGPYQLPSETVYQASAPALPQPLKRGVVIQPPQPLKQTDIDQPIDTQPDIYAGPSRPVNANADVYPKPPQPEGVVTDVFQPQIAPSQAANQPLTPLKPILNQPPLGPPAAPVDHLAMAEPVTAVRKRGRRKYLKPITYGLALLILIAAGYLFISSTVNNSLTTKTLSDGGFSYSFSFYKAAMLVHFSDGTYAYKFKDSVIAGVKPTNDNLVTNCSEIGNQWQTAFTVQVYGATRVVCTNNNTDYSMMFKALGHNQLFSVVYYSKQSSSLNSKLQTILSSVKVNQ